MSLWRMPLMIMGLNWQPAQTPGVFDADRISVEMDMFAVAAVSPQVRTPERDNVIDEPNLAQRRDCPQAARVTPGPELFREATFFAS
ncbi:hypothetical protein NKI94_26780 [Mesorhizobium australicum]|uniref:hypothetical protein n=1 Tax=Mesorhizobium australicum TaxID=536018 RepID=UPI003338FDC5